MAERKDEIMSMVRDELKKDPDIENKALYAKAKKIDPAVDDLTLRQFHARYPLQVKRKMAQKRDGGRKRTTSGKARKSGGGSVDREAVRSVLLRFARDVSAAEGKAEMIDVLSSVDDYVDDVVGAAGG